MEAWQWVLKTFVHLNKFVEESNSTRSQDLVQYAINLGFDDWKITTYEYAMKGDKEAVNYYLKLSKDYNQQLRVHLKEIIRNCSIIFGH